MSAPATLALATNRSWNFSAATRSAAAALDHHRGRLDGGRRLDAGREAELLHRVAGDRGGDQKRPGLDLHQGHHTVDLDRAHDPGHPVAGRQLPAGHMTAPAPAAE